MQDPLIREALNDDELDQLADFLAEVGSPAMNIESLDGFFCALVCGPETVMLSEYLPIVLGEEPAFESEEQAGKIFGLLMRHWNTIATTLYGTLEKDDVYLPVLLEDEEGIVHGNDWAQGFIRGVQCRLYAWQELINSDEFGGPLVPIFMLVHEHDPDPDMRPPAITPDSRDDLLQSMIAGLTHIYRYFAPHRHAAAAAHAYSQAPVRRATAKVGRNDPCPCGSGRKFKNCCADSAPTLH